ncbi:MAG: DUF4159 domain-containing protein [Acidobacteria bacterium]|nr:DUF4159 domain-containing protein [Acidobacteriota bacterium]
MQWTIDDFRNKGRRHFSRQSLIVNRKFLFRVCLIISLLGILSAQDVVELPRNESKFTFARIRFNSGMMGFFGGGMGMGDWNGPPWAHDWPRSEEHLMKILAEVTRLDVNPGGHIISFQNDDCYKYPIAYLCEVGFMQLSEEEAHRMAQYLLRGGFLIVDDFRGEREFNNFKRQLRQVFPNRSLEELPHTHPIWTCFYDISDLSIEPPYSRFLTPQYFGMSDDNGRLMMVVDYNNDISDYWEWSDDPIMPIESTNEAYKYGVNYIMYALTH